MAGDQTDGYAGVPGIGIKRADALLEQHGSNWQTVVDAFAEKGLDEGVALLNARLAKILQAENYDFLNEQIKHWVPTSSSDRTDNGAAVQVASD
jgi:DNA polymerase-1